MAPLTSSSRPRLASPRPSSSCPSVPLPLSPQGHRANLNHRAWRTVDFASWTTSPGAIDRCDDYLNSSRPPPGPEHRPLLFSSLQQPAPSAAPLLIPPATSFIHTTEAE